MGEAENTDHRQSAKLFRLTLDQKSEFAHIPSADPQRGWSHLGAEKTGQLRQSNIDAAPKGELTDEKVSALTYYVGHIHRTRNISTAVLEMILNFPIYGLIFVFCRGSRISWRCITI